MAEKKHSRVTESEKKRHKKAVKRNRFLAGLGITVLVVALVVFGVNKFISGMYNNGETIDEDIRTADDLQDKVINVLVCGIDYEAGRDLGMTDVIMYVTLDVEGNKVSALQIPRDVYIGDDVKTGGTKKINGVYSHGDEKNQIMNLVKAVNDKLSLPVDHYVTLDMEAFVTMVNGIDWGFEMYVPCEVVLKDNKTGQETVMIAEPGWYTLSGEDVEKIVRNRNYGGSDTQRSEVQRYFYASLIKNFKDNLTVSDFIKVMSRFTTYITTDMHWTTIASMAKFGFGVDFNDMTLIKPATHGYNVIYTGNTYELNIQHFEKDELADTLNEHFRPYQDPVPADELEIPGTPPAGEVTKDFGVVAASETTIGELLGNAPAQQ
ncbi:MAG: LCP family protein [Oscillospiraceae bacterium]|nr:LCP family protein [Oscillospiraceae bacterium]